MASEKTTTDAPADQAEASPALLDDFGFGDLDAELGELFAEPDPPATDPTGPEAADEMRREPAPPAAEEPQAAEPVDGSEPEPAPEPEPVEPPTIKEVQQAAEELAMLDALKGWVSDELAAAKSKHSDLHARYVNLGGNRKIPLRLPSGVEIGTWNVSEATSKLVWDDEAVLKHVTQHSAHNLYDIVDSAAAARYDDVVEFIRLTHPELIRSAVRPAYLTLLAEQLDEDGKLLDKASGELIPLAKRVNAESDGSGRAGWKRPKGKPDGKAMLIAAWQRGEFKSPGVIEAPPYSPDASAESKE